MNNIAPTLHRDGTVTYWSVYQQAWILDAFTVPDRELAAMTEKDCTRVRAHLARVCTLPHLDTDYMHPDIAAYF